MSIRVDLVNDILDDGTVICNAVKQGCYFSMTIKYPGDVGLNNPIGQIRNASIEDGGTVLGNFSFQAAVYNPGTDKTELLVELTNVVTDAIPETEYQYTVDANSTPPTVPPSERNCWYYDIKAEDNSGVCLRLIDYGLIQVLSKYSEV
jgi:hypothetical protein